MVSIWLTGREYRVDGERRVANGTQIRISLGDSRPAIRRPTKKKAAKKATF
jgi:hypothetical protein